MRLNWSRWQFERLANGFEFSYNFVNTHTKNVAENVERKEDMAASIEERCNELTQNDIVTASHQFLWISLCVVRVTFRVNVSTKAYGQSTPYAIMSYIQLTYIFILIVFSSNLIFSSIYKYDETLFSILLSMLTLKSGL